MMEFFEKHWVFLVIVSIFGSFVIYSLKKERKEEGKKQSKDMQNKTNKGQKGTSTKGGLKK